MEAKDTIMHIFLVSDSKCKLFDELPAFEHLNINRQAEISFKAGIKEVVDWLERVKKIKVPKYQLKEWGLE